MNEVDSDARSSIKTFIAKLDAEHGWDRFYHDIKLTASQYPYSYKTAKIRTNRNRNRYGDVSPFDHSRIKLAEGDNDYINSNLVKVEDADRRYILSQGPLPNTSGHMWQMIWEQNSKAVIMLNKVIEKATVKCDQYWPRKLNGSITFENNFEVSLKEESVSSNFVVRKLELRNLNLGDNAVRHIYQFHYTAWPDFGVPESPNAFLEFLECVQNEGVLDNSCGPAVIHCSAGIGRSGTFALVDACSVMLNKGISPDIRSTLLEMRTFRMGLIQTTQQLRFSYLAISQCKRCNSPVENGNHSEENGDDDDDNDDHTPDDDDSDNDSVHDNDVDRTNDRVRTDSTSGDRKRPATKSSPEPKEKRTKEEDKCSDNTTASSSPPNGMTINSDTTAAELRRRIREERQTAIQNKIDHMKEKLQKSESGSNKSVLDTWYPYVIGGIVASAAFGVFYRYWWSQ